MAPDRPRLRVPATRRAMRPRLGARCWGYRQQVFPARRIRSRSPAGRRRRPGSGRVTRPSCRRVPQKPSPMQRLGDRDRSRLRRRWIHRRAPPRGRPQVKSIRDPAAPARETRASRWRRAAAAQTGQPLRPVPLPEAMAPGRRLPRPRQRSGSNRSRPIPPLACGPSPWPQRSAANREPGGPSLLRHPTCRPM